MKYIVWVICLFVATSKTVGQDLVELQEGVVSYLNSQNVYVKFAATHAIRIGDTLLLLKEKERIPALEVKHLSSISCVGIRIDGISIEVGDVLVWRTKMPPPSIIPDSMEARENELGLVGVESGLGDNESETKTSYRQPSIRGRLGVGAYAYFSNTSIAPSQRMRYTFSLQAKNPAGSRFSVESYMLFRHRSGEWSEVREDLAKALKVYSLAVSCEPDDKTSIILGRSINRHITNLGASDGIQMERRFGQVTVGAIMGTRPDPQRYDFNPDLFQYGGFISHAYHSENGHVQTSGALIEQRNHGFTDRRFAYFQHTNSLLKNVYAFSSLELDLYQLLDGQSAHVMRPTSVYVSLRYRASRKFSISTSYDARKNVIYFETYKSFIDDLIEKETRQGLRLRFNYRPMKYITLGSSVGYRFEKGKSDPAKNLYSYLTISRVPWLKMSISISATLLENSYIRGGIYGIRSSKDLVPGKLFCSMSYRVVNYQYGRADSKLTQDIGGGDLTWRINKNRSLSVNYEGTFQKTRTLHHVYANIIQRF